MKTLKKTTDGNKIPVKGAGGYYQAPEEAQASTELSHRSMNLDWEQTMLEYAVIERRAQAMRSEAAWNMARALRNWAVRVFSQGKAKAGAAAATPLARQGQPI